MDYIQQILNILEVQQETIAAQGKMLRLLDQRIDQLDCASLSDEAIQADLANEVYDAKLSEL